MRDKPPFSSISAELLAYLKGAEVIIHNAAFDIGFLDVELSLAQQNSFRTYVSGIVDTLVMAKEMFPGKRNSLDALCDRLGVDNAARTLHGALLDAELLADVYINLTRGQDALLMDAGDDPATATSRVLADLSSYELQVVLASVQEIAAHEDVLMQIDNSSGGKTLWRMTV